MEPCPSETTKCRRDGESGQDPPQAFLPGVPRKVASDVMPRMPASLIHSPIGTWGAVPHLPGPRTQATPQLGEGPARANASHQQGHLERVAAEGS